MADAKTYARKLMVVSLSDKANEEKKKEEETIDIDPVSKIFKSKVKVDNLKGIINKYLVDVQHPILTP